MIDVELTALLYGIAAALPHMIKQKSGHIINVSSVAGHKVRPGSAVYAATKAAVRMLSEGLRQEVKPYNIRTTIISPGAVQSELLRGLCHPDRQLRAHGRLRDQPARRGRRERDPVPPDRAGAVTTMLAEAPAAVGAPHRGRPPQLCACSPSSAR